MANEGGAKASKAGNKEKRQARKAKRAGSGAAGASGAASGSKEKSKNPLMQEARTRYSDELRKQGVADADMKAKVKTHLKDVVKPAMSEAKQNAKSKNLKGAERKKFIQEAVRGKLGLQA